MQGSVWRPAMIKSCRRERKILKQYRERLLIENEKKWGSGNLVRKVQEATMVLKLCLKSTSTKLF